MSDNNPGVIGKRGLHAAQGNYAWIPVRQVEGVAVATDDYYRRRFSLLDASDSRNPQWLVEVSGNAVELASAGGVPVYADSVGQILGGGLPVFPGQILITYTAGGYPYAIQMDVGGGVRYPIPAATSVQVDVVLPIFSARLVEGAGGLLIPTEDQIPQTIESATSGLVTARAWSQVGEGCDGGPQWSTTPPDRWRNRLTQNVDVFEDTGNETCRVPRGATSVTIYTGSIDNDFGSGSSGCRWLARYVDNNPVNWIPCGDFPVELSAVTRRKIAVPGIATHLQLFAVTQEPTVPVRFTLVWDLGD